MDWLKLFISSLTKILKEPPYLVFLFIGAVSVIVAILTNRYFDQVWFFFLYSISGTIWRYIQRDLYKNALKKEWMKTSSLFVYHAGNLGLLVVLFKYLNLL